MDSSLQEPIQEGIWPLTNFVLKQETISLIEEIQSTIAHLGSLNKSSEALCDKPLDLFDGSSFEIHHKIPLKTCITKEDLRLANRKENICLLIRIRGGIA